MIRVFSGRPAWTWAPRANFIAVSTASEPEQVKNTRAPGIGVRAAIRSSSASAGSLVKGSKHEYVTNTCICRCTVSAISSRPCPMLHYHRLPSASTSSRPSLVHSSAPSPRTIEMKFARLGFENGCRKAGGMPQTLGHERGTSKRHGRLAAPPLPADNGGEWVRRPSWRNRAPGRSTRRNEPSHRRRHRLPMVYVCLLELLSVGPFGRFCTAQPRRRSRQAAEQADIAASSRWFSRNAETN